MLSSLAINAMVHAAGGRIEHASIRFGTIAYLCFGGRHEIVSPRGTKLTQYDVEIEIGSDNWVICKDNQLIHSSDHTSYDEFDNIQELIVNQTFENFTECNDNSFMLLSDNIYIKSKLEKKYSSGFLYSISRYGGGLWESIDGKHFY
jgi:hypothetical protein